MNREDVGNLRLNLFDMFKELGFPLIKASLLAMLTANTFDELRQSIPPEKGDYPHIIHDYDTQSNVVFSRLPAIKVVRDFKAAPEIDDNLGFLNKLSEVKATLENYGLGVEEILISLLVSKDIFAQISGQIEGKIPLGDKGLAIGHRSFMVKILYPDDYTFEDSGPN